MTLLNTVNIRGTDFGLLNGNAMGTCTTPAGSEIKVCTFSDLFELKAGINIAVKFTYANTYGDGSTTYPKLSINGVSYPIRRSDNSYVRSGDWANLQTAIFMFNGTDFILTNPSVTNLSSAASLPIDAVLHYSFDEVPDFPDGTADVRLIDNNTYGIQSTDYAFSPNTFSTLSSENGKLKMHAESTGVLSSNWFAYIPNQPRDKILKIKFRITELSSNTIISIRNGSDKSEIDCTKLGSYEISFVSNSTAQYPSIYFYIQNGSLVTLIIDKIYIGNGSYSTPIIDNVNGENNAVNNGGVATKGVSGKGVRGFANDYNVANAGSFNFANNFTISMWVNPANTASLIDGYILFKSECINIRNGFYNGTDGIVLAVYKPTEHITIHYSLTNALLAANTWHHLVLTKNGTSIRFYLNGVFVVSRTLTFENIAVNNSNLIIHRGSDGREASYDDFLVFDRAISDAEVTALYLNHGNTPKYYSWADWKLHQME